MPSNLLPPAQIAAIRERCEKSLPNTMGKWPGDVVLPLLSHADAQAARIEELEKALEAAMPYVESAAEPEMGYGFFCGGDPREFHPDSDATEEELANHKAACEAAEKGEMREADGKWVSPSVHITRCQFGLGSYSYHDENAVKALAIARAALNPTPEAP